MEAAKKLKGKDKRKAKRAARKNNPESEKSVKAFTASSSFKTSFALTKDKIVKPKKQRVVI